MIVVAIVGILAAVAIPHAIKSYTKKAAFSEIIAAAAPYTTAVATCVAIKGADNFSGCNQNDAGGIPTSISTRNIASVVVAGTTAAVTITVTPTGNRLLSSDDVYTLTGEMDAQGTVTWTEGGQGYLRYLG